MTAFNFEVEVPIGSKFSFMVEDIFPWYTYGNKWCLEMWELGFEPRYWFKRTPVRDRLSGHFIAPYAMSAKFDFQYDRSVNYQGEYWSAGVTYGYAIKLARWFNMEFSFSAGFVSSSYRHYYPADDYSLLWRDRRKQGRISYIGPTKLKVSFVIPFCVPVKRRK